MFNDVARNFQRLPATDDEKAFAIASFRSWYESDVALRGQLDSLVAGGQWSALFDAFYRTLPFGTGGRRGPVGIGPNRFNARTLTSSVQGHADYLRARYGDGEITVVVAYDVRQFQDLRGIYDRSLPNKLLGMRSVDFARIAAGVYAANDIRVCMPRQAPEPVFMTTPEVSFSIRRLGAQGGLYVSASHNHPDDNGGKLFNADGGQEVPPRDQELAEFVERVSAVRQVDFAQALAGGLISEIDPGLHRAYVGLNSRQGADPSQRSALVVFTPLHGTGITSVYEALGAAGFKVHLVQSQADFDGQFPTVPFRAPNPEVSASMQVAIEQACAIGADVVMCCDPDADRLGMCARDRCGNLRFINGNQLGILVTNYRLAALRRDPAYNRTPLVISTEVTTGLLRKIAEAFGAKVIDDLLVGFKYHGEVLNSIEHHGHFGTVEATLDDFAVATEESHGLLMSPQIRDKDAAGAAVVLAELASVQKGLGRTVFDYLSDIYREHGYYANLGSSLVMTGAIGTSNIRRIQASLREHPPDEIGGAKVTRVTDHLDESGRFGPFKGATDLAARDMLVFDLEDGARILVRPSGTEPKNKTYTEVRCAALGAHASEAEVQAAIEGADARAQALTEAFSTLMLERIDVVLPVHALRVSGLVSLDARQDFAERFLPELEQRLLVSSPPEACVEWIEKRLASYGKDPRALVARGIQAYISAEQSRAATAQRRATLEHMAALFT